MANETTADNTTEPEPKTFEEKVAKLAEEAEARRRESNYTPPVISEEAAARVREAVFAKYGRTFPNTTESKTEDSSGGSGEDNKDELWCWRSPNRFINWFKGTRCLQDAPARRCSMACMTLGLSVSAVLIPENKGKQKMEIRFFPSKTRIVHQFWHFCSHL